MRCGSGNFFSFLLFLPESSWSRRILDMIITHQAISRRLPDTHTSKFASMAKYASIRSFLNAQSLLGVTKLSYFSFLILYGDGAHRA